jgi:hypothetical protein
LATTKILHTDIIKLTTNYWLYQNTQQLKLTNSGNGPEDSTPLISKHDTGYDPETVQSTSHLQKPISLKSNLMLSSCLLLVFQVVSFQEAFTPKFFMYSNLQIILDILGVEMEVVACC